MIKKPDFCNFDAYSLKLKRIWKITEWGWSKMGVATLVSRPSKLKKESME